MLDIQIERQDKFPKSWSYHTPPLRSNKEILVPPLLKGGKKCLLTQKAWHYAYIHIKTEENINCCPIIPLTYVGKVLKPS